MIMKNEIQLRSDSSITKIVQLASLKLDETFISEFAASWPFCFCGLPDKPLTRCRLNIQELGHLSCCTGPGEVSQYFVVRAHLRKPHLQGHLLSECIKDVRAKIFPRSDF